MAIQIRTSLDEIDTSEAYVPHRPARPDKVEGGKRFELVSDYQPAGDQPTAIRELVDTALAGERDQVLLGVTGSGKTFTMAKVIDELQRPALILAPNKILAAQLYGEFKSFFPNNAVEYFVSYYDYYQPEAYVPRSDTYIEKESSVNEAIDRMRHSATRALLERDDVIIVASVSCLYGIGSVETYSAMIFDLKKGQVVDNREIIRKLVALQYKRNDQAFARGNFRVRGDSLEIFPSHYEDMAWRVSFFGDEAAAGGSKITAASSPAACPVSRRRRCSNICPTTPCSSSTKATRRSRRSARCRKATIGARSRSPNMASACRAVSTTGRCASPNGI